MHTAALRLRKGAVPLFQSLRKFLNPIKSVVLNFRVMKIEINVRQAADGNSLESFIDPSLFLGLSLNYTLIFSDVRTI